MLLPHWLRNAVDDLLRVEYAIGVARPEAAVPKGHDLESRIVLLVNEATPELRAACRHFLLGYALAPHAKWNPPSEEELQEDVEDEKAPTKEELEAHLGELARSGDRDAIKTMLAALAPDQYGPPGRKPVDPDKEEVDAVDWAPATK